MTSDELPDPASDDAELPDWIGSFSSGRGDLAERHEEMLRGEETAVANRPASRAGLRVRGF